MTEGDLQSLSSHPICECFVHDPLVIKIRRDLLVDSLLTDHHLVVKLVMTTCVNTVLFFV